MSLLIIAGPLASGKTELIKRIVALSDPSLNLVTLNALLGVPPREAIDKLLAMSAEFNVIAELALDDDQTWPYTDVPIWRLRTPASRIGFRPDMIDKDRS